MATTLGPLNPRGGATQNVPSGLDGIPLSTDRDRCNKADQASAQSRIGRGGIGQTLPVTALATQSGTRALGPELAGEFLARVRNRLDAMGSPQLTATFVGQV